MLDQLAWLTSIRTKGGKAVMEIALDLRDGLEGFPENPPLAFRWLQAASSDFDYPPAHFLYAQWIRDDDLFSLRSKDNPFVRPDNRQGEYLMANSALLRAADHHDIRAETEILRLLKPVRITKEGAGRYIIGCSASSDTEPTYLPMN